MFTLKPVDSPPPRRLRALVTGASSGIGYELSGILATQGHDLILVARRERLLQERAAALAAEHGCDVTVIPADLAVPGAANSVAAAVREQRLNVDFLFNSAGFAANGAFVESNINEQLQLLQVNMVALTHLTHLLLPAMVKQGWGRVLNIASIGAFLPGPLMSTYFASKAYLVSFSRALWMELRGTGVSVTALVAGPTRTGFAPRARLEGTLAFRHHLMDPHEVAEEGYWAAMKGRQLAVAGFRNKLRMVPLRLVPQRILGRFAQKYHEQPSSVPVEAIARSGSAGA
jgi:short-subunit dehydrogenase